MATYRRQTGKASPPRVAGSVAAPIEVDLDLDLNALDDPDAGFAYVETDTDTSPGVFDARPCDPAKRPSSS